MSDGRIGYKEAKRRVLAALAAGSYRHETRDGIDEKNKLLMGDISAEEVSVVIRKSTGTQHTMSPHHASPKVTVHTIICLDWYIKFYFVTPNTVFISVHPSR